MDTHGSALRGVLFGPDGKLYVSVFDSSNLAAGHILKYDVTTGAMSVFATNDGDGVDEPGEAVDLHRPEGLTFGPGGRLYITSFRANASDTDKILILNGASGVEEDTIPLDQVGQPRAFAQAIVFGPGGDLFVPITGNGPDTGAVRRYDVIAKTYTNFVAAGTLAEPWYLTFGNTDPATLAYIQEDALSESADQVQTLLSMGNEASKGPMVADEISSSNSSIHVSRWASREVVDDPTEVLDSLFTNLGSDESTSAWNDCDPFSKVDGSTDMVLAGFDW